MKKKEKLLIIISLAFALCYSVTPVANAMHIMEGYLPYKYCIAWGVICLPFLAFGLISIKKTIREHKKTLLILAMVGAYAFVLSALKIPSVSGSSSHPTGTGLGAILFGPTVMSVIGIIILLFQALLLAHGGITTIGANTFSMAIAGPILSYIIYKISLKVKLPKKISIFLAATLGDLFTYYITSFQLALAYPSEIGGTLTSMDKFMSIFAVTQIPLAIIEGILSVIVIMALENYAKTELTELGYLKEGEFNE